MRNIIEHILLLILWLLVSALGVSFWFSAYFGFNVFSGQHWEYLGNAQASQMTIDPVFYISVVVSAIIVMCGMYVILRPRIRKIAVPVSDLKQQMMTRIETTVSTIPVAENQPAPKIVAHPTEQSSVQPTVHTTNRPPRLNIPRNTINRASTHFAPAVNTIKQSTTSNNIYKAEFIKIFEDAGYVSKQTPRIANLQTDLFAVGANDVLWVGAYGAHFNEMKNVCDKLQQIFDDFLDDVSITINAFVVNSPDANALTASNLMHFASTDELKEFISKNPNPAIPAEEQENFDAYSAFITTVAEYIGKI